MLDLSLLNEASYNDDCTASRLTNIKTTINKIYDATYNPSTSVTTLEDKSIIIDGTQAIQYVELTDYSDGSYILKLNNILNSIKFNRTIDLLIKNSITGDATTAFVMLPLKVSTYSCVRVGPSLITIPPKRTVHIEIILLVTDKKICLKCSNNYSNINFVDLGLTSNTLWADKYVGYENGGMLYQHIYFCWGNNKGVETVSTSVDKWYSSSHTSPSTDYKYIKYNYTDQKTQLDLIDDPAYLLTNGNGVCPTSTQIGELISECTFTYSSSAAEGYKLTIKGPNGNTITYNFMDSNANVMSKTLSSASTCLTAYTLNVLNNFPSLIKMNRSTTSFYVVPVMNKNSVYIICLVENTEILLSNKTVKHILDINYDDDLYVYDTLNNAYTSAKPYWIMKQKTINNYVKVTFDDNTYLNVSRGSDGHCHRLYCPSIGKYIQADLLVNRDVLTVNGIKRIISVEDISETVNIYNIITKKYLNFFANNILTGSGFINELSLDNSRQIDEFNVSTETYEGLDLLHTSNSKEDVINYINKLNELKK